MDELREKVTTAYEEYEFHLIYHTVHNFCTVDLSAIYLDILKDRVYTGAATSVEQHARGKQPCPEILNTFAVGSHFSSTYL